MLGKDQSFSMTANMISPGYQRIVLKGYLVDKRSNGTYVAPLIPQLFYGFDGTQLQTWRQNITATGEQVILSRTAGGYPEVPREELYWRKVSDMVEEKVPEKEEVVEKMSPLSVWWQDLPPLQKFLVVAGGLSAVVLAVYYSKTLR